MKELTVCFVIVNLALAHGYGFTRKYDYPNKDLIISDQPFGYNKLAYGVCEGNKPERKCKIYQELIQDGSNSAVQICKLKLKYTGSHTPNVNILNAGTNHVILTVKEDIKVNILIMFMGTCDVHKTTIVPDAKTSVVIVPRARNFDYDVIFESKRLCGDFLCKATYDYYGNAVKKAAPFGIRATKSSLVVREGKNGFLVGERRDIWDMKVYFVRNSDHNVTLLYSTPVGTGGDHFSLSMAENKLSFCSLIYQSSVTRKIVCQQFDAEGRTKILETESYTKMFGTWDATDVLNLEDGLFSVWIEAPARKDGQPPPLIQKYDGKNKPIWLTTDLHCGMDGYSIPKLFKNSIGDYCISSLCRQFTSASELDSKFSRTYKCFTRPELS